MSFFSCKLYYKKPEPSTESKQKECLGYLRFPLFLTTKFPSAFLHQGF